MIPIYPVISTENEKVPYDNNRSYDMCTPYIASPSHGGKTVCSDDFIGLFLAFMRGDIVKNNIGIQTTTLLEAASSAIDIYANGGTPPEKWIGFIECLGL